MMVDKLIDAMMIDSKTRVAWWLVFFFFFFQAEDGIRDLTVTGVQTCAVPISQMEPGAPSRVSGCTALRRPGPCLSFGVHYGHARFPQAPPVSGSFCREAEEAGVGERAWETITVGGSSPGA